MVIKQNPLIVGADLICIIANPFMWAELDKGFDHIGEDMISYWCQIRNIQLRGCGITFPDYETKTLFLLKWS